MTNPITKLFNIKYPIIQAGMIWCSGWELASAVSNAGGLGLIGSGSMYSDVLREHIKKCKAATDKPFGVNVPLLYPNIEEHMKIIGIGHACHFRCIRIGRASQRSSGPSWSR